LKDIFAANIYITKIIFKTYSFTNEQGLMLEKFKFGNLRKKENHTKNV
jgi:hypothetical protein